LISLIAGQAALKATKKKCKYVDVVPTKSLQTPHLPYLGEWQRP